MSEDECLWCPGPWHVHRHYENKHRLKAGTDLSQSLHQALCRMCVETVTQC